MVRRKVDDMEMNRFFKFKINEKLCPGIGGFLENYPAGKDERIKLIYKLLREWSEDAVFWSVRVPKIMRFINF